VQALNTGCSQGLTVAEEHGKEGPRSDAPAGVVWTTIIFLIIIALLPFLMDFAVRLSGAFGEQYAKSFFLANRWLLDVLGYVAVYIFMLFYMKTTFEPLRNFGYKWSREYFWWSVYIGLASGVIIFLVDWLHGLDQLQVSAPSLLTFFGYLLSWALLPAFVEETLFRGVVQQYYQRTLRREFTSQKIHVAIIIAVLFELLFHLAFPVYAGLADGSLGVRLADALPQLIYVAVFGFIGGVIYQRTCSLAGPIIIHALGNFAELLLIWGIR
jgi:membrane protease YdiL (CAAX protease family)